MEQSKLITDKIEIEKLIDGFFGISSNSRLIKELTHLANQEGYSTDYQSLSFKHDINDYDLDTLQQPMTDRHVLVSVAYPMPEGCEAYVTFEDFYEYIGKSINRILKRGALEKDAPFDEYEILQLLEKIKISLGVH